MEKLQKQMETIDHKIDMIMAYYFLVDENYPLQSLDLVVETLSTHPDLDEHLPGKTLEDLMNDVKHIKDLIRLMIDRGERKKKLFRL